MSYAILKSGGKQYRVRPGDVIDVERLVAEEGSSVELADVLAVSRDGELTIGDPIVPQASVSAHVQAHDKDKKIIVFKYKRKVRYRRKKGHRQHYTRLAITAIVMDGEEIASVEELQPRAPLTEEPPDALGEETVLEVSADTDKEPSAETTTGELDADPAPNAAMETFKEHAEEVSVQLNEAPEDVEAQPPEATPIEAAHPPKTPKKARAKPLATSKKAKAKPLAISKKTPKKAAEKNK